MRPLLNKKNMSLLVLFILLIPSLCMAAETLHLNLFSKEELEYFEILLCAFGLGCLSGFTHGIGGKSSIIISLKTYGAVSLGSAIFSCACLHLFLQYHMGQAVSGIGNIVTGIGFLCAAVIFKEGFTLRGLSTAASLWTTASIGAAAGMGLLGLAIAGTAVMIVFHLLPSKPTLLHHDETTIENVEK